jgi:hypothetical protein
MLTENDASSHGRLTSFDGSRRPELGDFLQKCVQRKTRNIAELRGFFGRDGLLYHPYRDTVYLNHER